MAANRPSIPSSPSGQHTPDPVSLVPRRDALDPAPLIQPSETPCHAVAPGGWHRTPLKRTDLLLAVVFFTLALAARWPFILRGETLLHSDEAIVGIMADDIAAGRRFPIYFYGQRYMGALEAYAIAAVQRAGAEPITALRLAPAIFFAALVAVQFLMLTRWFGRSGGVVAALALIAAAPMFLQWSISARGGYIEVFLWGALLWWACGEWCVPPAPTRRRAAHLAVIGALFGSGFWINPAILVFALPLILHALLDAPLATARATIPGTRLFLALDRRLGPLALFAVAAALVIGLNLLSTVHVADGRVVRLLLWGLVPRPVAVAILVLALGVAALLARRLRLHAAAWRTCQTAAPLILGACAGLFPALIYVAQRALSRQPLEDAVPLGMRPIWTMIEPAVFLIRGLPLLLGPDGSAFLELVRAGRSYVTQPLPPDVASAMRGLNVVALVAWTTALALVIRARRAELAPAFRLRPGPHPPIVLIVFGCLAVVAQLVTGGAAIDFTAIRYLLPLCVMLPGLLAALWTAAPGSALAARRITPPIALGRSAICLILAAGVIGQIAFFMQLGAPHPLRPLAAVLRARGPAFALAEPLDAHLLTFLTSQNPPIGEYQSFWPRLAHLRAAINPAGPLEYIVDARDVDWHAAWRRAGWPGKAPPECYRFLWPALKQRAAEHPEQVLAREPLTADGYERWRLARPLPERTAATR